MPVLKSRRIGEDLRKVCKTCLGTGFVPMATAAIALPPKERRKLDQAAADNPIKCYVCDGTGKLLVGLFCPLSVKPLDNPNFDPGETIILDRDTAHISVVSNRDFAQRAVAAINALEDNGFFLMEHIDGTYSVERRGASLNR